MGFNDKQIAARDSKVNKIIVSAGAGTGKTTVLAERVKKLLIEDCYKDNTNITNFLILTFTKAAASSMKKKFKKAINEALENETDKDKISFLKKQLIYINNADISTIDSFCEKIVKENSSLCGIKSDFDILSEIELSFIEDDILDDLIEEENIFPP